ncbi:FAD-dependent oxidoreductase [Sphingomonas cavernae]|uniref:FAD-dependent oxidoreductase n=1 Tax=Sphingomonas cavernae TaxID=2320861 RepID=A0A418WS53_9SPHN|nr:FAD-dependent oxidoreductase [Sphingomonas cavernae]RJF93999.1 FAD-dependent oxidoreductase [Sphingomonas cavernae]
MAGLTRRGALGVGAGALASSALGAPRGAARHDVIVVGAGVFGAWTAARLQDQGKRVLLLDAWGPAHARASSGGESRMTRGSYGADAVYTRMAWDSLGDWQALSDAAGLPVFHKAGVLFFFPRQDAFVEATLKVHRELKLPTQLLDIAQMRSRFPQIDFAGIELGLYEPAFGALMARRAVQTLVDRFVRAGGAYRQAAIVPPDPAVARLDRVVTAAGETLSATQFVFACGPWLPRLFPDILGRRIFPTRQEVFFFAPPAGDARFGPAQLPGWADFNDGDIYYGFPDLENRGFKIAHDAHGLPIDPDTVDRTPSAAALADVRSFMARRFPALAKAPLSEARVCQYENSANGDLLIDRHPRWANTVLVGAGSGHGFKHGPAVGRYAAALVTDTLDTTEPRFSLASKGETQVRAVH